MIFRRLSAAMLVVLCLAPALMPTMPIVAAAECESGSQYFPATNRCVGATFYAYWQSHGGLAQQGLPITDEIKEISPIDGKTYTVQYFERARFEHHPEQADPQYRVLLGLLGLEQYKKKYPTGAPPRGGQCTAGEQFFEQTRHCVSALFYAYWRSHGGLAQQGLPLSDAFMETNPTDGKRYLTQYFERARFEHHPENAAPYDVLLGLLGREQLIPPKPEPSASPKPDLRFPPAPLTNQPAFAIAEDGLVFVRTNVTYTLQWRVENIGAGPSPAFELGVFIECVGAAARLGTVTGSRIASGGSSLTPEMQIRVPAQYFARNDCRLTASIDPGNVIAETNENNNTFRSAPVHIVGWRSPIWARGGSPCPG